MTGGAGFVGSHLVDALMRQGHQVTVLDNLYTGSRDNVQQWIDHPNFKFFLYDVTEPIHLEVDRIYHLAAPAAPLHYQVQVPYSHTARPGSRPGMSHLQDLGIRSSVPQPLSAARGACSKSTTTQPALAERCCRGRGGRGCANLAGTVLILALLFFLFFICLAIPALLSQWTIRDPSRMFHCLVTSSSCLLGA